MMTFNIHKLVLICLLLLCIPFTSYAEPVTLRWQQNNEPDLQGYYLYYGTSPRNYGSPTPTGNVDRYTLDLEAGQTYYFALTAVDTSGNESGYSTEISHYLLPIEPLSINLTTSEYSPQTRGQVITFTGAAEGGSGNYEYAFRLKDTATNVATTVQDYSSDTTWNWNTEDYEGDYKISLWVRNIGSSARYDAYQQIPYKINGHDQPLSVVLNQSRTSPSAPGENVLFTASTVGGSGNIEYEFRVKKIGESADVVQAYSADNTWRWRTENYSGNYLISVWARSVGSSNKYDAYQQIAYAIRIDNSGIAVSLSPNVISPQERGLDVDFISAISGGSGNYEYSYRLKDLATNISTTVQGYSLNRIWRWDTNDYNKGNYLISVWVREVGSTAKYETYRQIPFRVN